MEWLLLIAVFLAIIGYVQIRCPKCYSLFTRSHLSTEEIDRWQGSKTRKA